jgi:hypothetical protein
MAIDGNWVSALGSLLQITSSGTSITGTYQVIPGNTATIYPLVGSIVAPGGSTEAVGWTILWTNASGDSNTLSSYAGMFAPGNPDRIFMTWLRRTEVAEANNWAATQIGADVFNRSS